MAFISSKIRKIPKKPHALSRQEHKFICTYMVFSLFAKLIIKLLSMDKPNAFVSIYIINNLCKKSLGIFMINQLRTS